jgi:hypothetical protein
MSGNKVTKQVNLVTQSTVNPNLQTEDTALFSNGVPLTPLGVVSATTATAAATAAKTVTNAEPPAGTLVALAFTAGNSVLSPTVSFNGGTVRNILLGGTAPAAIEITIAAGGVGFFWFDGTSLHQLGVYS